MLKQIHATGRGFIEVGGKGPQAGHWPSASPRAGDAQRQTRHV